MFQLILLWFGLSFMGDLHPTGYFNTPYTAPDQEHFCVAQSANDSRRETYKAPQLTVGVVPTRTTFWVVHLQTITKPRTLNPARVEWGIGYRPGNHLR